MREYRESLLSLAESGDHEVLLERLEPTVRHIHSHGGAISVEDSLLTEAFDFAKAGDMETAAVRLRQYARPKFRSIAESQAAYDAAMQEKRACA